MIPLCIKAKDKDGYICLIDNELHAPCPVRYTVFWIPVPARVWWAVYDAQNAVVDWWLRLWYPEFRNTDGGE